MINVFGLPPNPSKNGFALFTNGIPSALKANLAAAVDPTVADDAASGYVIGSVWINTVLKKVFVCVDSTGGAAVWRSFIDPSLASNYATSSGTNTYTATLTPTLPAYVNGLLVTVRFGNANSGASTLNIDSRGAKNIYKNGAALVSGDIQAGALVILAFNNSDNRFDMVAGGTTSSGSASSIDPLLIIGG